MRRTNGDGFNYFIAALVLLGCAVLSVPDFMHACASRVRSLAVNVRNPFKR